MVSPRKSRRKSACFSSTTTSTPARASSRPSIMPAGPPPTMQHDVWIMGSTERQALAGEIAQQQERSESQYDNRSAGLDAAQRQRAVAGLRAGEFLRQRARADRERGDRRHRDRG